jgi:molybdopterin converting factor small subunit
MVRFAYLNSSNLDRLSFIQFAGDPMDDDNDKSIVEKTIQTVKEIASSVSNVAKHAMESEPIKAGDEVVMIPMTDTGMFGAPVTPQFIVVPARKKSREKPSKSAGKKAAKTTAKKMTKKSSKKSQPKPASKKTASKKVTKKKVTKKKR